MIQNKACEMSYKVVSMSFDTLPSSVSVDMRQGDDRNESEFADDEFLTITTDGHIYHYELNTYSYRKHNIDDTFIDIQKGGFCPVSINKRYGAFLVATKIGLGYVNDFWRYESSSSYSKLIAKPQIIHVSKKELIVYEILA